MDDVRESLGVLGELVSHVDQVINLKDYGIMRSLAMRYLIIEIGSVLKVFCNSLIGREDFAICLERVSNSIGKDKAEFIDKVLRLRNGLIEGGSVKEDYLEALLNRVGDLYIALERSLASE